MAAARWYPTCLSLADGRALIVGGDANRYPPRDNDEFEIFDSRDDSLTTPDDFDDGWMEGLYPVLKLLPDGSSQGLIFVFSLSQARFFDPASLTWRQEIFHNQSGRARTYPYQGASVMLPLQARDNQTVRILMAGGQGDDGRATNTAEIFEFVPGDPASSSWRYVRGGEMSHERFMSDGVLLPDGTVFIVNGASEGKADDSWDAIYETELFNPTDESWTSTASLHRKRMYHSEAALLPDGRVLMCGNTRSFNDRNPVEDGTIELFSPPYLFRDSRPSIKSAPASLGYGQNAEVTTEGSQAIARVTLLKVSSTTHTNNMDQRLVELPIVTSDQSSLTIQTPADSTVAPPGYYFLFLLNESGVPSVGSALKVS